MMSLVWKLRLYLEKKAVEFELRYSSGLLMELESAAQQDAFTPLEAAVDLTITHPRACPMSFGGSDWFEQKTLPSQIVRQAQLGSSCFFC